MGRFLYFWGLWTPGRISLFFNRHTYIYTYIHTHTRVYVLVFFPFFLGKGIRKKKKEIIHCFLLFSALCASGAPRAKAVQRRRNNETRREEPEQPRPSRDPQTPTAPPHASGELLVRAPSHTAAEIPHGPSAPRWLLGRDPQRTPRSDALHWTGLVESTSGCSTISDQNGTAIDPDKRVIIPGNDMFVQRFKGLNFLEQRKVKENH